jgi:hypothetical protein
MEATLVCNFAPGKVDVALAAARKGNSVSPLDAARVASHISRLVFGAEVFSS